MPLIQKPVCDECGRLALNGRYIRKDSVWYRIEHGDTPEKMIVQPDATKQVFCSPGCALAPLTRALIEAWNRERGGGVRLIDLKPGESPPPGKTVREEIGVDGHPVRYYEA